MQKKQQKLSKGYMQREEQKLPYVGMQINWKIVKRRRAIERNETAKRIQAIENNNNNRQKTIGNRK